LNRRAALAVGPGPGSTSAIPSGWVRGKGRSHLRACTGMSRKAR